MRAAERNAWFLAAALALVLMGFWVTRARFGPGGRAAPGRVITYVCTDPRCGESLVLELSAEAAADPSRWPLEVPCPYCGGVQRRAERCTACGALVPTPADGRLLGARCPGCGGYIFGPIGGTPVEEPIRRAPPSEAENGEDREPE